MKRQLVLILSLIFMFTILVGCGDDKIDHNYTSTIVYPTCTEQGYTLHICNDCGDTYKDTYVDALGHKETDWILDENPTCTKEGTKHTECEKCGEKLQTLTLSLIDHNYTSTIVNPTCTEEGYTQYVCNKCEYTYTDTIVPKIEHNYVKNKCTICGKNPENGVPYKENGKTYINFGRYPQTVVTDTNLIKELDKITITNEFGYIEYNGNEYKKQVADPYTSNSIFQNGEYVVEGKTYYFKVEPIKWRVLETTNGSYKLLSEYLLDTQYFFGLWDDRTLNGQTIYANNYEYSNIRAWLNGYNGTSYGLKDYINGYTSYGAKDYTNKGFIDIAFTKEEQAIIKTTLVDNSVSSTGDKENQYVCDNTNDKIYLLSYKEATNTTYGFISDSSREAQPTDYAAARYCIMYSNGNGRWWLRSPSNYYSDGARYVNNNGGLSGDYVYKKYHGVRAALEINLTI